MNWHLLGEEFAQETYKPDRVMTILNDKSTGVNLVVQFWIYLPDQLGKQFYDFYKDIKDTYFNH